MKLHTDVIKVDPLHILRIVEFLNFDVNTAGIHNIPPLVSLKLIVSTGNWDTYL